MIEAIAGIVETAKEVAVSVEECRISIGVVEDMRELLNNVTKEVGIVESSADEVTIQKGIEEFNHEGIQLDANAEYVKNGHFYETNAEGEIYKKDSGIRSLTEQEKLNIKEETGWSDGVIDYIENMDQYEIYKKAELHEEEINGRKCLVKNIDLDYIDPKTGLTNRERMNLGRSPIDPKTGEKIELHHMGQEYDSPFAELCENSEHGDGNHSTLHTKSGESWRNTAELKNKYINVDKPCHWKERAKEV